MPQVQMHVEEPILEVPQDVDTKFNNFLKPLNNQDVCWYNIKNVCHFKEIVNTQPLDVSGFLKQRTLRDIKQDLWPFTQREEINYIESI